MAAGAGMSGLYNTMLGQSQLQAVQDPNQAQQEQLGYVHPQNVQSRVAQNNGLYQAMMSAGQMSQERNKNADARIQQVDDLTAGGSV